MALKRRLFESLATSRPLLVVLGDTPVAAALRTWAPEVGFDVTTSPPEGSSAADLYVVHTDHDAPDVTESLATALRSPAGFVGIMGSRRHVGAHIEALRALGFSDEDLARVRSPLGLDLGGKTPVEIALSIAAGLVAARTGRQGGWLDR